MTTNRNIGEEENFPGDDKKAFFNAPEGYFDSFSSELIRKIEREELQQLAPVLFSLEKTEPFSAPRSYFDYTDQLVSTVISEKELKNNPLAGFFRRWALAFPVLIAAVIGLYFYSQPVTDAKNELSFENISQEEYDAYMQEEAAFVYEDDDLTELIALEDHSNDKNNTTRETDDEMENYIIDEVDLDELIAEL